ncbi:MAG: class I SAM-dependent methyltransferase [Bryobacteraceae bacterium]|jgi:SAM-dependent methyltransferase
MKPPSDYVAATTAYYDAHAAEFCENTVTVDVSELYAPFLHEIPAGGRILDAGCGSGRDSLAFLRLGYQVVSIDASAEMVAATTKLTGKEALLLKFDALDFDHEFDGIWACGSLVHIARQDLHSILTRLSRALKPSGVLYMSFKHGDSERMEGERFFNDLNEAMFGTILGAHPALKPIQIWVTEDLRNYRRGRQRCLNAIVRHQGSGTPRSSSS